MTHSAAVIGLGLIGGSIGAALRRSGYLVHGWDRVAGNAAVAHERGLVDVIAGGIEAAVTGVRVVILAVPVLAINRLLAEIDRIASPHTVLIDTGSVKRSVVGAMEALPGAQRAIGGHPIAGSEQSGPAAADPDLLAGRRFVLCRSSKTDESTLHIARETVAALGMRPVELAADAHDRIVARTSHLPQLLSTALSAALRPGDAALAGPALRDMTRLAASDPALWRDIVSTNNDQILVALDLFRRQLDDLAALVAHDDVGQLEDYMRAAAQGRALVTGEAAP